VNEIKINENVFVVSRYKSSFFTSSQTRGHHQCLKLARNPSIVENLLYKNARVESHSKADPARKRY
jgi:hypothetical protein